MNAEYVTYLPTYIPTFIHTYIHAGIRTYICTYIRTHTHQHEFVVINVLVFCKAGCHYYVYCLINLLLTRTVEMTSTRGPMVFCSYQKCLNVDSDVAG